MPQAMDLENPTRTQAMAARQTTDAEDPARTQAMDLENPTRTQAMAARQATDPEDPTRT